MFYYLPLYIQFGLLLAHQALSDNSVFHGLLTELIIPSVRSHDALLRERGLTALGLCGTIDKV